MEAFTLDPPVKKFEGLYMHCDRCKVLSYCYYNSMESQYRCIDIEVCHERWDNPIVQRAKELGVKLKVCKEEGCESLVGYTGFASTDYEKVITQTYCIWHLKGMGAYNSRRPISHGTEQGYRKGCRDYCCLAAHAEKIKTERNVDSSLKRIPEVHEIESILDKLKDPKYMPSTVEIYAIKIFLERFPRFFTRANLLDVAPRHRGDSEDEQASEGQGGVSEDQPEGDKPPQID